jgi:hypothetical protein
VELSSFGKGDSDKLIGTCTEEACLCEPLLLCVGMVDGPIDSTGMVLSLIFLDDLMGLALSKVLFCLALIY